MKTKIVIISILLIINTLFAQDLIVPWFKVSGTLTTGSLTTSAITNTGTSTVGTSSNYISMTPTTTTGMLTINANTSGNWSGIKFSGAGFNNASDYLIYFSTNNYWNAAGQAVVGTNLFAANGSVTINSAAADGENAYDLIINADMDADGTALTADEFRISATPASNPTAGVWSFTSTQSAGYLFDRTITTRDTVSAREAAGSVYTYFIPGGSLVTSSSREQKENIIERTMSNTDVLLDKIKIYQYNFKEDSLKSQHISMMADDWYEISAGFGGNTKEINYEHVMSFMLLSLKNQNAEIKELKKQLKDMKSQVTIVR